MSVQRACRAAIAGYYTYLWLREDGTPYYVGKGKNDRGFTSKSHRVKCPKDASRILVQEFPSEADAFAAEIFLIAYYGRKDLGTGILHNMTAGGDAPPSQKGRKQGHRVFSEEHKANLKSSARARKGYKRGPLSEKNKAGLRAAWVLRKQRIASGEETHPSLGRTHSLSARKRMSESAKTRRRM